MYENIKVDDSCLRGKHIIGKNDIIALLPEEIRENVEAAFVYVNLGQAQWVVFLKNDNGAYSYQPFAKEMTYEPYAKRMDWGRIYFWRKARYLRDHYQNKGTEKKVYSIYVCRPNHMFLLREIKQYWLEDENGPGYSSKDKWFRAFP